MNSDPLPSSSEARAEELPPGSVVSGATPSGASRARGKPRWYVLLGILTLLLVGATCWLVLRWQDSSGPQVPLPDLSMANAQVATVTGQLHQLVKDNPRSVEAWATYGAVLMAHEWNSEALACFSRAAELDPKDKRWPYLAGILLERREPDQAIEWYEKAKELDPGYAPLYMRLSNAMQRLGRTDEAEAALRSAAKLAPAQPQPLIGLARMASARGDWTEASRLLEQAAQTAPSNREAIVELTRARLILGTAQSLSREEQAAVLSGEKYQPMPDPVLEAVNQQEVAARYAAMQADQTAARGNLQQAAESYVALIKQRPDLSRPRLNLASVYMAQGQVPQAIATLREVVKLFPNDPMGHYALGAALEASGELAEARREQEIAVELKPDYAEAHFALGLMAEREGNLPQAIEAYRRAVQSDVRLAQAHLALGVALHKQQRWDEAIEEIKVAVQLSPGDPVPQSFLQKALTEKSARQKASVR